MKRFARRLAVFLVVFAAAGLAVTSIPASNGDANGQLPVTVYCLNGVSTTLPAEVVFTSDEQGSETGVLSEELALEIIADAGGLFYTGWHPGDIEEPGWYFFWGEDPAGFLDPGYTTNTVSEGACSAAAFVHVDRSFWLCFTKSRNPAVYPRGLAMKLHEDGYTVPYAAQAPVSDTNIGNGVYLTCAMPAGYSVKAGVAVSTGGGDIFTGPPDLVKYMLTEMPLDYTVLVAP